MMKNSDTKNDPTIMKTSMETGKRRALSNTLLIAAAILLVSPSLEAKKGPKGDGTTPTPIRPDAIREAALDDPDSAAAILRAENGVETAPRAETDGNADNTPVGILGEPAAPIADAPSLLGQASHGRADADAFQKALGDGEAAVTNLEALRTSVRDSENQAVDLVPALAREYADAASGSARFQEALAENLTGTRGELAGNTAAATKYSEEVLAFYRALPESLQQRFADDPAFRGAMLDLYTAYRARGFEPAEIIAYINKEAVNCASGECALAMQGQAVVGEHVAALAYKDGIAGADDFVAAITARGEDHPFVSSRLSRAESYFGELNFRPSDGHPLDIHGNPIVADSSFAIGTKTGDSTWVLKSPDGQHIRYSSEAAYRQAATNRGLVIDSDGNVMARRSYSAADLAEISAGAKDGATYVAEMRRIVDKIREGKTPLTEAEHASLMDGYRAVNEDFVQITRDAALLKEDDSYFAICKGH